MIGRLRGILLHKQAPQLLIDVHGVAYEVDAPMTTFYDLPEVGKEIVLHTHLVVRDDAQQLYGFIAERDRTLFRQLIKVNGVGAKTALAILSGISADAFARCILESDMSTLTRVPGVGKKTAERLFIELRDRLSDWSPTPTLPSGKGVPISAAQNPIEDAVSALISLGYKPPEASRMVRDVESKDLPSEEIIRRALQASVKSG